MGNNRLGRNAYVGVLKKTQGSQTSFVPRRIKSAAEEYFHRTGSPNPFYGPRDRPFMSKGRVLESIKDLKKRGFVKVDKSPEELVRSGFKEEERKAKKNLAAKEAPKEKKLTLDERKRLEHASARQRRVHESVYGLEGRRAEKRGDEKFEGGLKIKEGVSVAGKQKSDFRDRQLKRTEELKKRTGMESHAIEEFGVAEGVEARRKTTGSRTWTEKGASSWAQKSEQKEASKGQTTSQKNAGSREPVQLASVQSGRGESPGTSDAGHDGPMRLVRGGTSAGQELKRSQGDRGSVPRESILEEEVEDLSID